MRKLILMASVLFLGFTACNSGTTNESSDAAHSEEGDHAHVSNSADFESIGVVKSDASASILDAYFAIKIALQEDNSAAAAEAGNQLVESLASLSSIEEPSVEALVTSIQGHGDHISKSDIEHQRAHFEPLSHDLKGLIGLVGTDRVIYEQYCPMYDNDKGGMWLSDQEELLNPLFGSSMLRCGTTTQKIEPKG